MICIMNYTEWHTVPLTLPQMVNPGFSDERREEMWTDLRESNRCCIDECTQKVLDTFANFCSQLKRGLIALAISFKFTNMQMERLLALIRQATNGMMNKSEVEAMLPIRK